MKTPKFNSTLSEIFDFCAVPNAIVERKELLMDFADEFPGIEKYVELAFGTPTEEFAELLKDFPAQQPVCKVPNRQMTFFSDFLLEILPKLKTLGNTKAFRAKLIQEMDFLEPRDFELLLPMLKGEFTYQNKKINEVVLSMAFPQSFPNQ